MKKEEIIKEKIIEEKIIEILEQGFSDISEDEKKTNKVQAELILELFKSQNQELLEKIEEMYKTKGLNIKGLRELFNH